MIISSVLQTQCALKNVVLPLNLHILKSHGLCVKEAVLYHDLPRNLINLRKFKVMIASIGIIQPSDTFVYSHIL